MGLLGDLPLQGGICCSLELLNTMGEGCEAKFIERYTFIENIGKGEYGVVKLARHNLTGAKVAIKIIDKTKLKEGDHEHLHREILCLRKVEHPNIIRLYEVSDTKSKLYLVLELGENGDLYDYISHSSQGVGEDESRDLFYQILEAVSYCHRLHIVHRDLKPENVVFCQDATRVKVTDFGLSNLFAPGEELKTSCGSLSYAAPEILLGDTYDAPAVDIWGLGVILYMLLVGQKPFAGGTDGETLTMIMDCDFFMPSHLSAESIDLVQKMIVSNPKERIKLDQIVTHPWIMDQQKTSMEQYDGPGDIQARLGDEGHKSIIDDMIQKEVASETEIESSLASNTFDHVYATYHLMAETVLQKKAPQHPNLPLDQTERLDRRRQHVRRPSRSLSATGDLRHAIHKTNSIEEVSARAHSPQRPPPLTPHSHPKHIVQSQDISKCTLRRESPIISPVRVIEPSDPTSFKFDVSDAISTTSKTPFRLQYPNNNLSVRSGSLCQLQQRSHSVAEISESGLEDSEFQLNLGVQYSRSSPESRLSRPGMYPNWLTKQRSKRKVSRFSIDLS